MAEPYANPYSLTGTATTIEAPAASAVTAMPVDPYVAAAQSITGGVVDITGQFLDYFGEGATEQAAYAAQTASANAAAVTAQAAAAAAASQNTVVGWATANPITAAGVVLGALFILSKIAKR